MDGERAPGRKPLLRHGKPAGDAGSELDVRIVEAMPPAGTFVKISYLIKALNVKEIPEARHLEVHLKQLVRDGRLDRVFQDGKWYYTRKA